MRKILTLLTVTALSSLSFISQAQEQKGRISGRVEDGSQKVIESATVSLLRSADSSLVKINAADKTGKFVFDNIPTGKYLISVSAVGHQKAYTTAFEIGNANATVDLKPIALAPATKDLTAVTVVAKKPLIEQKIDRTVVNVEASPTNVGSSALEVLEKSPGITVDKDGNISLKGKEGVMVLVDGRPTQLGGADLANLLRSMNASQLDQIEIMTNPPAKFDAAGNAGIINIKTKKNKQFGYNGTVSVGYGQGRYPKTNESLNFNYRQGKVNVFTTLSHNYRQHFEALDIQRRFYEKGTKNLSAYFDQEARMQNKSNSYNGKLGMDYFASKNTTIGFVVGGLSNPGEFVNRNTSLISDVNGQLTSQARALSSSSAEFKNFTSNLNFRQVLDTTGKELTADFDFLTYDSRDQQNLSNYYYDNIGNVAAKGDTLYGLLPQKINIWSGKADYLHPLKKGARFEAGIKSSIVKTDNNANYDTVHNGQVMHDYSRSNYFIYEENINAAYVNLSGPLSKKWNGQLGLRLENTNARGNQVTDDTVFNRNYTQLFPTAFLQYVMDKNNQLSVNYGRRIRRPNYESLNPFIEFLDRYTYQQGNPDLKPQFSHNIELSHTHRNFLTTTLNYTQTNDIIQQVIEQNAEKQETFIRRANIARQRQYGISVNANVPITKWWTSSIYVNASDNLFEGIVNDAPVTVEAQMVMLNTTQQFKLGKTLSAEISGFYRTKGVEGVIITDPMGMVNFGLSQQVLKNKGTVRLNVRDIFYTQRFQAITKYGDVDAAFQNRRDSRVVNVGFTYRFSKGKMNGGSKRRTGGANDEQSRVGVADN